VRIAQSSSAAPASRTASGAASARALAALLVGAGTTHLVRPGLYEPLIPPRLGPPRPWVLGSGVAELVCGAAVLLPGSRRVGALAAAALFVAVFPGNVQMALDSRRGARSWARRPAVAWGRLPFQVPLVLWALRIARAADPGRAAGGWTTTSPRG
jgi:uncharacterized membrane protein